MHLTKSEYDALKECDKQKQAVAARQGLSRMKPYNREKILRSVANNTISKCTNQDVANINKGIKQLQGIAFEGNQDMSENMAMEVLLCLGLYLIAQEE